MRGLDGGSGNDPDAGSRTGGNVIGSSQNEEFKSHYHYWSVTRGGNSGVGYPLAIGDGHNWGGWGTNTDSRGGNETRSKNKAVLFCIKY